jgi:cell division protein ZapA (FtsZ GTPase activity inhibitor)
MSARSTIQVRILGQDYRIVGDATGSTEEQVEAAASQVDETMRRIRDRTGTVDTAHVAVLTALNVANRLLALRDERSAGEPLESDRIRGLIELVESATGAGATGA